MPIPLGVPSDCSSKWQWLVLCSEWPSYTRLNGLKGIGKLLHVQMQAYDVPRPCNRHARTNLNCVDEKPLTCQADVMLLHMCCVCGLLEFIVHVCMPVRAHMCIHWCVCVCGTVDHWPSIECNVWSVWTSTLNGSSFAGFIFQYSELSTGVVVALSGVSRCLCTWVLVARARVCVCVCACVRAH